MDRDELKARLDKGLFVSAMMGVMTGHAAAKIATHAAMVQLGAILLQPADQLKHDPRFVLPNEVLEYVRRLSAEIRPIREALGSLPIAWNTAVGDVESACLFAEAAAQGGADLYEVNFNGGYGKLIKRNIIRAMVMPHNRKALVGWLQQITERSPIPVVAKFFAGMRGVDYGQLAEDLAGVGLFGIHLNVRSLGVIAPNLKVTRLVRERFLGMLLCSGRVAKRQDADALFAAGADAVGVAKGLIDDAFLISKLVVAGHSSEPHFKA